MWIIQFEDNLGKTSGILAHGAEDRRTCEILMQEYARSWAHTHPDRVPSLMYSQTKSSSPNPGLTVGVEVGDGVFDILLEMSGVELHGIVTTHVLDQGEAEAQLLKTMFEVADIDDLIREHLGIRPVLH